MYWLTLIIFLICSAVFYKKLRDNENLVILFMIGTTVFGILIFANSLGIVFTAMDYANTFYIDKKIEVYVEENKKIEKDVSAIVSNYLDHESSAFKEITNNPEVLAVVFPELKSNEIVSKQIDLYIKNNEKIKDLKLEQVTREWYEFLLFFG